MRKADEALLKDLSYQITLLVGSLLSISFGEHPAFEVLISKRKSAKYLDGAVDRLFGGSRLHLSTYQSESDWASLFSEMDTTVFEELGNRTITQAYFGHMNMQNFKLESEVSGFYKALKKIYGGAAFKDVNLRRVFVGIRYALMMTALNSIRDAHSSITSISDAIWLEALKFGIQK